MDEGRPHTGVALATLRAMLRSEPVAVSVAVRGRLVEDQGHPMKQIKSSFLQRCMGELFNLQPLDLQPRTLPLSYMHPLLPNLQLHMLLPHNLKNSRWKSVQLSQNLSSLTKC